jgi:hypothetical protein
MCSIRTLCSLAFTQAQVSHRCHSPVVHPHVGRAKVNATGALQAEGVASDWRPIACIHQRRLSAMYQVNLGHIILPALGAKFTPTAATVS